MVNVHGHTDTHTQTHTRLSNHMLNPFSHVFWNISPTSIYFKNQCFCANLFGRAKASLFTIEEIWNKQPCPSPLWLLQTNYQLSTNMPSEKQINKQKKNLKPGSHHFGGSNKSFYLQRPRAGEIFFFFFLNEQRHTAPWEQRGSQEPLGHGATSLTSLAKGKSRFNCPSLFFHSSL